MHEHAIRILRFQVDHVLKEAMRQDAAKEVYPGELADHQAVIDDLEVSIAALERDAEQHTEEDTGNGDM